MRIEVTAEDIEKGEPRSSCSCPVTLAIRRATMIDFVMTGYLRINIGHCIKLFSPDAVKKFISAFDNDEPVKPFEFDLPVPEPTPCASK